MSNIIQSLESCSFTECDEKTDDDYDDDDDDVAGQGAVERLGNTADEKDASEVLKPVANLEFWLFLKRINKVKKRANKATHL